MFVLLANHWNCFVIIQTVKVSLRLKWTSVALNGIVVFAGISTSTMYECSKFRIYPKSVRNVKPQESEICANMCICFLPDDQGWKSKEQGCIPVGCVLTGAVAISWGCLGRHPQADTPSKTSPRHIPLGRNPWQTLQYLPHHAIGEIISC